MRLAVCLQKECKQIKPKVCYGKRSYYHENSINILKKIKYLLKDKVMTLIVVNKVLHSYNSVIDELYNISINQKNIIKSKVKKIKHLLEKIKDTNG